MSLTDRIRSIHTYSAQGKSEAEIAALVGVEIGDVQTVLTTVTMPSGPVELPTATGSRQAAMWDGAQWVADGVPRIIACPLRHDTAGLAAGVDLWTPQVNDLLLDVWVEITEAWDGTTPMGDVGIDPATNPNGPVGWFYSLSANAYNPPGHPESQGPPTLVDMTNAARDSVFAPGLVTPWTMVDLVALQGIVWTPGMWSAPPPQSGQYGRLTNSVNDPFTAAGSMTSWATSFFPARISLAHPVKFWVTQDGMAGSAAPGATQGSAIVHLVVATPASG